MATSREKISSDETRCAHAAVIGNEALRGKLLGSGPIMHKVDQLVAEVCNVIAHKPVVTVAFDAFKLLRPVFHGDFVRLEGRAISVGSSSMVCQVSVYRQDFATGAFELTHNVVATFVALDANGRVSRGLPMLHDPQRPTECAQLSALAAKRKAVNAQWNVAQADVATLAHVTHAMLATRNDSAAAKRRAVDIQTTVVETRHTFLLKHANLHRNVFGGVLLEWMDRSALYCARNFTKNYNMVTVGMDRVHFRLPIFLQHLISIRARVCRVRKYSVEVEIAVYRGTGESRDLELSHTGYFDVLNIEEDNRMREIHTDVTARESDQDGMRALLKAQQRQLFAKEDAELLAMAPIPLSAPTTFLPSPTARI